MVAELASAAPGPAWPLITPLIGAFGTFVTGFAIASVRGSSGWLRGPSRGGR